VLIEQGRTSTLVNLPWAAIDVSESRIEEVVYHIARWASKTLGNRAFQLVFPVKSRDLSGVQLLSPYLWARTVDLKDLLTINSVMGVTGVVGGDVDILQIEDEFVQRVLGDAQQAAAGWSVDVIKGSFVRVLMGSNRMLCGTVSELKDGMAVVLIKLRTRDVKLTIPAKALLALDYVPAKEREYYYDR
jgi:hypothetical protein